MTQEMDTRIGGRILGTIAVSSKSRLKGALVRIVIQARANAKITESPEAPRPKMKELKAADKLPGHRKLSHNFVK